MKAKTAVFLVAVGLLAGFAFQAWADSHPVGPPKNEMAMKDKKAAMIDHARNHQKVVNVTSVGLIPRTAKFREDDAIAWLNYVPAAAEISFDAAIAENLMCASPGLFRLRDGRLRASVDELGFASLCHISPGSYDYTVSVADASGAVRDYAGKIVVE